MTSPERIAKGMWWDRAWSIIEGCSLAGAGCLHCWSSAQTHMRSKQSNEKILARYGGLTNDSGKFNGTIRTMPASLEQPLKVRKPTTWAVWNDLFHAGVPNEFVAAAFGVMAACPQHTFIVLTKRPEEMRAWFDLIDDCRGFAHGPIEKLWNIFEPFYAALAKRCWTQIMGHEGRPQSLGDAMTHAWPPKNVCGAFSASTQADLERGIVDLIAAPWAMRGLSLEPLLGPIDLGDSLGLTWERCDSCGDRYPDVYWADDDQWEKVVGDTFAGLRCPSCFKKQAEAVGLAPKVKMLKPPLKRVNWIIVGAESGPKRRKCEADWIRDIRDQCQAAGVPFFLKQMDVDGALVKMPELDGKTWAEFPNAQR